MNRPNILLLFSDQHRGDYMPYSKEVFEKLRLPFLDLKMPNIKALMERGVAFTNCISPSPICAPARACLAFGTRYEDCFVKDNSVDIPVGKRVTLYSSLRNCGYEVMGTGKFDVHKGSKFWGEDGWVEQLGELGFTKAIDNEGKFDTILGQVSYSATNSAGVFNGFINLSQEYKRGPYIKYLHDRGLAEYHVKDFRRRLSNISDVEFTELPEDAYCDNWITNNSIRMLETTTADKPWFLQVNFTGPHDPWDIRREMYESVKDRNFPMPVDRHLNNGKEHEIIRRYVAMIENIDRNIGRILDCVDNLGQLENTIVIYASDHGEMLGDHDRYGKAVAYRQSINIPLVFAGPGIRSGFVSDAMVQLQDISATVAEYAKSDVVFFDSKSLKPVFENKAHIHRSFQYSALGKWKMIQDERYKYIISDSDERLFEIDSDVDEIDDKSQLFSDVCQKFRNKIRNLCMMATKQEENV